MRCEDIQKHLAIDPRLSSLPDGVRAHLLECPACRQAQAVFAAIDRELREQPVWQPPAGFAERVALNFLQRLSGVATCTRRFSSRTRPATATRSSPRT